jgi:tRNA (mo5U34)-methyltransferase
MQDNAWKSAFYRSVIDTPLQLSLVELMPVIEAWNGQEQHADAKKWAKQLLALPNRDNVKISLSDCVTVTTTPALSDGEKKRVTSILRQFMPWRKGPFNLFGVDIDTEWRSDWKWQRISPHIQSLNGKRVLDVGCGSGYHLFRMAESGAKQVIGIDPTALFFYQFQCIKKYVSNENLHFLPIGIEAMPVTEAFDTVFSMGVFYHRPDPLLFLKQLKNQLVKHGQLVLETLVVEGDESKVLVPKNRYAQMRNVYFLPSIPAMILWMQKVGFENVVVVDDNFTNTEEQRSTDWMTNQSLTDFLNPEDPSKTIEGYSAPRRATFLATR